jgi:hypothetical protein
MAKSRAPQKPRKPSVRTPARYKRSETRRLLRAATDAGLTVTGLEVDADTGRLRVLVGKSDKDEDAGARLGIVRATPKATSTTL